jgi:ATP-dependent helicase/nuclease subunit B
LFLRVVDYKTGKQQFSLSDLVYGRNMQMLIYLFALIKQRKERFGENALPAGVLYVPARDVIVKASKNASDEVIAKEKTKKLRRSGLVLNNPLVLEAMESGENKKYLPVKYDKDGIAKGDSLVNSQQTELLSKHVENMLFKAAREILGGEIKRSPHYKSADDNTCRYCEYHSICGFDEDMGDRRRFVQKVSTEEVWKVMEEGL